MIRLLSASSFDTNITVHLYCFISLVALRFFSREFVKETAVPTIRLLGPGHTS
jgi:hypothetical protein